MLNSWIISIGLADRYKINSIFFVLFIIKKYQASHSMLVLWYHSKYQKTWYRTGLWYRTHQEKKRLPEGWLLCSPETQERSYRWSQVLLLRFQKCGRCSIADEELSPGPIRRSISGHDFSDRFLHDHRFLPGYCSWRLHPSAYPEGVRKSPEWCIGVEDSVPDISGWSRKSPLL